MEFESKIRKSVNEYKQFAVQNNRRSLRNNYEKLFTKDCGVSDCSNIYVQLKAIIIRVKTCLVLQTQKMFSFKAVENYSVCVGFQFSHFASMNK